MIASLGEQRPRVGGAELRRRGLLATSDKVSYVWLARAQNRNVAGTRDGVVQDGEKIADLGFLLVWARR